MILKIALWYVSREMRRLRSDIGRIDANGKVVW